MLGTDFPYRPFLPEGVPIIQSDVRGEQIGQRIPVHMPLVGTVKDTVAALLPLRGAPDAAMMRPARARSHRSITRA
jgi:pyruvate dehydrogenase (quinone)